MACGMNEKGREPVFRDYIAESSRDDLRLLMIGAMDPRTVLIAGKNKDAISTVANRNNREVSIFRTLGIRFFSPQTGARILRRYLVSCFFEFFAILIYSFHFIR